jgi:hypothetical protein
MEHGMCLFLINKELQTLLYIKNFSLQLRRKVARRTMIAHLRQPVLEENV